MKQNLIKLGTICVLSTIALSACNSGSSGINNTPAISNSNTNQLNAIKLDVNYILDKSSKDGERKITNLCVFDGNEDGKKGWHWHLFYQSTGTSSGMANTVLPFYGFNENGQFIKPHGGNDKGGPVTEYYKQDYLNHITMRTNEIISKNFNEAMELFATGQKYDNLEDMIFNDDSIRQFFTRMDNWDLMKVSYQFNDGVWMNETTYSGLVGAILKTEAAKSMNKEGILYRFAEKPSAIIEPGTDVESKNKFVRNFVGNDSDNCEPIKK